MNRYGQPLSASGVRFKLAGYVKAAAETEPSLHTKHVTPHSFRHATTNHCAKANLETKRKALEQVSLPATAVQPPSWKRDASLLAWLDTL